MTSEAVPFSAPDPQDLAVLFPGYSIDSLIACGGMGAVYHARQIALDREVAIKILPREMSSDEAFRDGFAAEAKAMARLNHPNLIGVYDFGEVDGMLFIIMEFVPGQSLYHAAYQTAVVPNEAARLMSEICSGIAEAHRHGILHRDIKPANVLLDAHARPKIGDFGLARPIGSAVQEGEVIFGTPHYTAPEVINHPSQVDARADIFSLGVVLHELLTGKLPASDPRPPSAICGCSPKFDAIVKKATQQMPALRYSDADTMACEISALAAPVATAGMGRPGVRPPAVRRPTARVTEVRSSGGFGWGWVVLLLLLGGGGYYYYKNHMVPPPAPAVEKPKEAPTASIVLPPVQKPVEEPKADLPGPSDGEGGSERSKLFDHGLSGGQFGSKQPTQPKPDGPKPIFDVDGFLKRARMIMQQTAAPERRVRNTALSENIDKFDRVVSRAAREEGAAAVTATAKAIRAIREAGNRIPDSFEIEGLADDAYSESFAAAVKRQEEADAAYTAGTKQHAESYIRGLQMQIDRLKTTNDPGAVSLLQAEIDATKADEQHFITVIESSSAGR